MSPPKTTAAPGWRSRLPFGRKPPAPDVEAPPHPPDTVLRHALARLQALNASGTMENGRHISPGIWLAHTEGGDLSGRWTAGGDALLSLQVDGSDPGGWLTLNIGLGAADLSQARFIGLIYDISSPRYLSVTPVLRSGQDDGFHDAPLPDKIASYATASTRTDLIEITQLSGLPQRADWRDLVLFFPPETLRVAIHDFRFFIV